MLAEGDVVVGQLPQADGRGKPRPVLLLRQLPSHGDYLVCGISTQLHQFINGFDVVLRTGDPAFTPSGLKAPSVIRLGFLAVLTQQQITRRLGHVGRPTLQVLQGNLSAYLCKTHGS